MISSNYHNSDERSPFYQYFDVQIRDGTKARFKRNKITGKVYLFQHNCTQDGNSWNERGYGWGKWTPIGSRFLPW